MVTLAPGRDAMIWARAQRYSHSQVDFEKSAAVGVLPHLLASRLRSRPIEGAGCAFRAVGARI